MLQSRSVRVSLTGRMAVYRRMGRYRDGGENPVNRSFCSYWLEVLG
jgi:hypothetical protein